MPTSRNVTKPPVTKSNNSAAEFSANIFAAKISPKSAGRRPFGDRAMTPAERQRRSRLLRTQREAAS
jgi:hypothetical protein